MLTLFLYVQAKEKAVFQHRKIAFSRLLSLAVSIVAEGADQFLERTRSVQAMDYRIKGQFFLHSIKRPGQGLNRKSSLGMMRRVQRNERSARISRRKQVSSSEQQYLDLSRNILANGNRKEDRTGTGTISVFGRQMRFDLAEGFPLLTTKRVPFKLVASEMLWFLKGDTNIRYLLGHNNNIWNEWAFKRWVESAEYEGPDMTDFGRRALADEAFATQYDEQMALFKQRVLEDADFAEKFGELGDVYGRQWRAWKTSQGETIDQIGDVIEMIKKTPDSRRLIVSAWNPEDVPSMALPPCHTMFQFYVADGKLSCQLYQR